MNDPIPCPACTGTMSPTSFGGTHVGVCRRCKGLWFEGGSLARFDHYRKGAGPALRLALQEKPVEVPASRELSCPQCERAMLVELHTLETEIEVDVCTGCEGTFLDAGELALLRRRPLTEAELEARRLRKRASKERRERAKNREERGLMLGLLASFIVSG